MDYSIKLTKRFEKDLSTVPKAIQKKVIAWISAVELYGLRTVQTNPGFRDEALKGQRKGQRSARMNRAYRLIYKFSKKEVLVTLLEVNKHEY